MNQNPGMQNPTMLQSPQMMQQHPNPPPAPVPALDKTMDSITKAKSLVGPLRDSLSSTLKAASQTLHHNNLTDFGTIKAMDQPTPRFDKLLEDFYSISDQIELHLVRLLHKLIIDRSIHQKLPSSHLPENCPPVLRAVQVQQPLLSITRSQHPSRS